MWLIETHLSSLSLRDKCKHIRLCILLKLGSPHKNNEHMYTVALCQMGF